MKDVDPLDANLERIRRALLPVAQRLPAAPPDGEGDIIERSPLVQRLMFWRNR